MGIKLGFDGFDGLNVGFKLTFSLGCKLGLKVFILLGCKLGLEIEASLGGEVGYLLGLTFKSFGTLTGFEIVAMLGIVLNSKCCVVVGGNVTGLVATI